MFLHHRLFVVKTHFRTDQSLRIDLAADRVVEAHFELSRLAKRTRDLAHLARETKRHFQIDEDLQRGLLREQVFDVNVLTVDNLVYFSDSNLILNDLNFLKLLGSLICWLVCWQKHQNLAIQAEPASFSLCVRIKL